MHNGKQKINSLDTFLKHYAVKDKSNLTHTRIGSVKQGIFGCKFNIPENKMEQFYKLYHKKVIIEKQPEYLTEVQYKQQYNEDDYKKKDILSSSDTDESQQPIEINLDENKYGPILVDFDFR